MLIDGHTQAEWEALFAETRALLRRPSRGATIVAQATAPPPPKPAAAGFSIERLMPERWRAAKEAEMRQRQQPAPEPATDDEQRDALEALRLIVKAGMSSQRARAVLRLRLPELAARLDRVVPRPDWWA